MNSTASLIRVDVPTRFLEDHLDRGCSPSLIVVKRLNRTTRVDLDRKAYDDLLSDAEHYSGYAMSEFWAEGGSGIILSARATLRAFEGVERP